MSSATSPRASTPPEPKSAGVESTTDTLFHQLLRDFLRRFPDGALVLRDLLQGLTSQPERLADIQHRYYTEHLALWSGVLAGDGVRQLALAKASPGPRFARPATR